ncbi:MAG: FeoA domain-containing protein [bacterium]
MSEMTDRLTLDTVKTAMSVEVVEIEGGWGVRQRLNQMGIHAGDRILVKRSGIMGGPILIQVQGMEVALGRGMARKVLVVEKG